MDTQTEEAPFKRTDIGPCICCGCGMMKEGNPVFYRIKLERMFLNLTAVRRQAGLEQMMGSTQLANIMGPDEDMAEPVFTYTGLVCDGCANASTSLGLLAEIMSDQLLQDKED